jgi:hypothetical protein
MPSAWKTSRLTMVKSGDGSGGALAGRPSASSIQSPASPLSGRCEMPAATRTPGSARSPSSARSKKPVIFAAES